MNNQDKTKEELIKELDDLKQAYNALKNSESKYRLLAENSSDVIWILDNNLQFSYINPSVYQLRGISYEEALTEKLKDKMTPTTYNAVLKAIETIDKNEKTKTYSAVQVEIEQYHKNGQLIWVEVSINPMHNNKGEKIGYIGSSRDITKRKKAEKAMIESMKRFDSLLALVPVGIYVVWIRANGHMEFDYVSDRWCDIHQVNREAVLTDINQVNKMIHKDDLEDFRLQNKIAAQERKKFVWEGRFNIDNKIRWFQIESIPIFYDNGDSQWYGAAQEITKRKEVEKALQKSEIKLRKLNAQKDKFFSIIAHDLRSPFNSILGLSDLLIGQIELKYYDGIDEYASLINQCSQQAMDLLMNLLDWARAQTGRMEFNPEYFELVDLIDDNKRFFEVIAQQKSIIIKTELPNTLIVFADKQMISTIFRNLISNAIKFTKQGGEVKISAEKKSDEILISVSDNGIGIEAKRLDKLFRIDESNSTYGTDNEKGTGLGLILCKEFVENHGGKIWVESDEAKGSEFYFTLSSKPNLN